MLALLVLYSLTGLSSAERYLEISLARRRGFTRPALLAVAVGEPVVVLVIALPLGLLLATGGLAVLADTSLAAGTPIGLDAPSLAAAAVALAGGVTAAVAGSWGLWHGSGRTDEAMAGRRSTAAAVDAFAVALAGAGLIGLSTRGSLGVAHPDPIAALAPGLLAVGAGVLGLRLAAVAIRAAVPATRNSRHIAGFLAVREVARRRPEVLRQLLPLTVAVVLVSFAVTSWKLASDNRVAVADFETGASRVLDVDVRPGVDLVTAVRRADPGGHDAMAAAVEETQDGRLVAVDATRLAAVVPWPHGLTSLSAGRIARYLTPPTAPAVDVTGTALTAVVALPTDAPPVTLSATLFSLLDQYESTVTFGTVHSGTGRYTAALDGFCTSTCRLVDLSPTAASHAPTGGAVPFELSRLSVVTPTGSHSISFGAGRRHSWTASPSAVAVTTPPDSGVVSFDLPGTYLGTQAIVLSPADVPAPIPAVVTADLAAINAPAPPDDAQTVTGIDGATLTVSGEIQAPTLPEIGNEAALVDLGSARLAQTQPVQATLQVWLRHGADSSIIERLRAQGVTVVSSVSASVRATALDRSPLALAYRFVLASAPVAALLGLGSAAAAVLATRRRRRSDQRALGAMGIGSRVVIGSVLLEVGLILGVAWLVGAIVGSVASRLALASLPQFVGGTGGIPVGHGLPTASLVAVLAAMAVLFALTAVATVVAMLGRARRGRTGPMSP